MTLTAVLVRRIRMCGVQLFRTPVRRQLCTVIDRDAKFVTQLEGIIDSVDGGHDKPRQPVNKDLGSLHGFSAPDEGCHLGPLVSALSAKLAGAKGVGSSESLAARVAAADLSSATVPTLRRIVWMLGKVRAPLAAPLRAVAAEVMGRGGDVAVTGRDAATLLSACVSARVPPRDPLVQDFVAFLGEKLLRPQADGRRAVDSLNAQDVSMILWALGRLEGRAGHPRPPGDLPLALGQALATRDSFNDFLPVNLVNALTGMAALGMAADTALLDRLAGEVRARLPRLSGQEVAAVARAYADLGHRPDGLLEAVAADVAARGDVADFTPSHFAALLGAYADLHAGPCGAPMFDALAAALAATPPPPPFYIGGPRLFGPEAAAAALAACARLPYRPPLDLLDQVGQDLAALGPPRRGWGGLILSRLPPAAASAATDALVRLHPEAGRRLLMKVAAHGGDGGGWQGWRGRSGGRG